MRHAVQSRKFYRRKCKIHPKSMEMACLHLSGPVRGVPWPTWEVRSRQCFGNKSALVRFAELQPDGSMCWKALECTREDDARLSLASFSQDAYFKSQCSKRGGASISNTSNDFAYTTVVLAISSTSDGSALAPDLPGERCFVVSNKMNINTKINATVCELRKK